MQRVYKIKKSRYGTEVISSPWPWPRMTLKVISSWMSHRPLTSHLVSLRSDEVDFLARDSITRRKFKNPVRDFRYFGLVSEIVGIFLISWKMAEEIDFENRHFWNFKSHVTWTPTSDDLEGDIVVNDSSTLINTTIWFVAALSLIVDVWTDRRTYVVTDGHFYQIY